MLVNGIPTDISTFDLYTLMEQVRKEVHPATYFALPWKCRPASLHISSGLANIVGH